MTFYIGAITVKKISFQMSDSLEMALLAILAPAIRCEWGLTHWHEAGLTTVNTQFITLIKHIVYHKKRFQPRLLLF